MTTTTYRTVVVQLPPTPLGLLPERWTIEHWCGRCRQRVAPEQLVAHAQGHEQGEQAGGNGSFHSPETSGTLVPAKPGPERGNSTLGMPNVSMTTNRRRR